MQKEILRPGNFVGVGGKKIEITPAIISDLAKNFNNETSLNNEGYKVPVFVGHPENESTAKASGWIKSLFEKGGTLWAELDKLTEQTVADIKDFSFRDVSVSVYKNILQHLALTNTPAVPNLSDFAYSRHADAETWKFESETHNQKGDTEMSTENEIKLVGEKKDLEVQLSKVQELNDSLTAAKTELEESKKALEEEKIQLSKENETLNAENESLKKKMQDEAVAAELTKDTAFVGNLCKNGKLEPADREATINRLSKFSKDEIEPGKTAKDIYKESLEKLPVICEGGEHLVNGEKGTSESTLTKLTKESMEKNKLDFNTATLRVLAEHPELKNTEG